VDRPEKLRNSKANRSKSFGALLYFHLFEHGTRPNGTPLAIGNRWTKPEFAAAAGTQLRNVSNWLRDETLPTNFGIIDVALFGANPNYKSWRARLRRAHRTLREPKQPPNVLSDRGRKVRLVGVPPRIGGFVGRQAELDSLHAVLAEHTIAAVTQAAQPRVVHGLGGVGKTALAVEYAHRFCEAYACVWWCPSATRERLVSNLASLAVELRAASVDEPDLARAAQAGLRRLAEEPKSWLLIYDNVPSPKEIAGLLPTAGARVLITSRFSDWKGCADQVSLDVLPTDEAISFLQSQTGRDDQEGARNLSQALGCLPLALDHAAALCRRTQMKFGEYASRVERLIKVAPRSRHYPKSVFATFSMAIHEAARHCRGAERLVSFLAHCAPDRIPLSLLDGAIEDEEELLKAVASLVEVSLLKPDPFQDGSPAVTVHRLVQSVARSKSKQNGTAKDILERLVERLSLIYPTDALDDPSCWPVCAQFTPHLLVLRQIGASVLAEHPALLNRAGQYFLSRAAYAEAEPLLVDALVNCQRISGVEHIDTARSLSDLGSLRREQGNFAEARLHYERALSISVKALGSDNWETSVYQSSLAALLHKEGNLSEAARLFEQAAELSERTCGPDDRRTVQAILNLAAVYCELGYTVEAREVMERFLSDKMPGFENHETASQLNNFAAILTLAGELPKARQLLENVLSYHQRALGPEHPETASTLEHLAIVLLHQGNLSEAYLLHEQVLAIRQKVYGPEHHWIATTLRALAHISGLRGNISIAISQETRALEILKNWGGVSNHETALCMSNLGALLLATGEISEARRLLETGLRVSENIFGENHVTTAVCLSNLAHFHEKIGNRASARLFVGRALAIRERFLHADHFETAKSRVVLARLLELDGDFNGAKREYELLIPVYSKVLGPEHRETLISKNNLGAALWKQGDVSGAKQLFEYVLAAREKTLGVEDIATGESFNNLACVVFGEGDVERARSLLAHALESYNSNLGAEHPDTNRLRRDLASLLVGQGDGSEAIALAKTALAAHENVLGRNHPWTTASAHVAVRTLISIGQVAEATALAKRHNIKLDGRAG
jgi:tetratricopeptide (TPR) repeat protein